jgi:hypothetical protein
MGESPAPPSPTTTKNRKELEIMKRNHERLTKEKIEYLHILHVIWTVVSYYANLFGIDPWEDPTKIPVDMMERDGMTVFRFRFYSVPTPTDRDYRFGEIRDIIQQYLDYCILPEQTTLRPYMGGSSIYDMVEALYIDRVEEFNGQWGIHVIYVDNPLAHGYVMKKRGLRKGGI